MTKIYAYCAVLCGFVASYCGQAEVTSVTWTNVTDSSVQWDTPKNWVDANGAVLTAAPIAAPAEGEGYAVTIADVPPPKTAKSFRSQIISTGKGSKCIAPVLYSIRGDEHHFIRHTEEVLRGTPTRHAFSVTDPNNFIGFWMFGDIRAALELTNPTTFDAEVSSVEGAMLPEVKVVNAGAKATVHEVYAPGGLVKTGAGTLTVETTARVGTRLVGREGELVIAGNNTTNLEALLATAWTHLDASEADTLTTTTDTVDGYESVTKWCDVRGAGYNEATVPGHNETTSPKDIITDPQAPILRRDYVAAGLPLVSFGCYETEYASFAASPDAAWWPARTNCILRLKESGNVLEAFYVAAFPKTGAVGHTLLSGDSRHDFLAENGSGFFAAYNDSTTNTAYGDIAVNCKHVGNSGLMPYANVVKVPHTMSVGLTGAAMVNLLGTREYYRRNGGGLMGELILFTNRLSKAERALVNMYLYGKWVGQNAPKEDLALDADVVMMSQNAVVSVPANKQVKARVLVGTNDVAVVKKGAGALTVDSISAKDVTVQEGALNVGNTVSLSANPQPAAGAYIHLDATKQDTIITGSETYNGKPLITAWKDCRADVDLEATAVGTNYVNSSVYSTGQAVMMPANLGWFKFPSWTENSDAEGKAYAGFIVYRTLLASAGERPFWGSSSMDLYRGHRGYLIAANYLTASAATAKWTVNGVPTYPDVRSDALDQNASFVVIGFASEMPVTANGLCKDRTQSVYPTHCGYGEVGEAIVYHRKLSAQECRDTEAYLMKKWLNKTHPDYKSITGTLTFGADAAKTIEVAAGKNLEVNEISAAGTIVKKGAGTLKAGAAGEGVTAVRVEGGTLTLGGRDTSQFHFDAMDPTTFSDYFVTEEDGVSVTNIVCLADVRKNGLVAVSKVDPANYQYTNTFLRFETMADGVKRPYFDLGGNKKKSPKPSTALVMSEEFKNITESLLVYSDNDANYNFFLTWARNTSYYHYHRNASILFHIGNAKACLTNGYISVDGVEQPPTYALPEGFHVISLATKDAEPTYVDSFAHDRTSNVGGAKLCEMIGYSTQLSPDYRGYMQRKLMYKWFGQGEKPVWTNVCLNAVHVAAGARFELDSREDFAIIRSLSGGGTVKMPSLGDVNALSFAFSDDTTCDAMVLEGCAFTPAATVSVTVTMADILPAAGNYTLLSADAIVNGNQTAWNLTTDFGTRASAKLVVNEAALILQVRERGTTIFLR